jgi:hypothetical protein
VRVPLVIENFDEAFCFKLALDCDRGAQLQSSKIQSDVPTASLLASKARGLNLMVFAKHRLKANLRVNRC